MKNFCAGIGLLLSPRSQRDCFWDEIKSNDRRERKKITGGVNSADVRDVSAFRSARYPKCNRRRAA
jgi:hypothetical protein